MDSLEFPTSRRELQGPRPTPLKVRKDSHKVKKPPIVPQPSQPPQHRPPVIIYTVSPKVIHADVNDFMTLVQRLTGSSSSSSSSSSSYSTTSSYSHISTSGAISPAARFAMIEKTNSSSKNQNLKMGNQGSVDEVGRTGLFPGILSPGPSSLPPISPNFFCGLPDQNSISFLHDLSPLFHGNNNYIESNLLVPQAPSFFPNSFTSSSSHISTSGAISPAARFAIIENTNSSSKNKKLKMSNQSTVDEFNMDASMDRMGSFPGILSPVPSSLPPISPNFFSGLPDQNSLNFFHDLSPLFHGNKNHIEGTLIPTPTTFFSTPMISPTTFDLFNQFLDF